MDKQGGICSINHTYAYLGLISCQDSYTAGVDIDIVAKGKHSCRSIDRLIILLGGYSMYAHSCHDDVTIKIVMHKASGQVIADEHALDVGERSSETGAWVCKKGKIRFVTGVENIIGGYCEVPILYRMIFCFLATWYLRVQQVTGRWDSLACESWPTLCSLGEVVA